MSESESNDDRKKLAAGVPPTLIDRVPSR